MKKLLLFLLVLAGGVSTASAKTFYVRNNCNWEQIYLYAYTGDTKNANWPGVELTTTKVSNEITYFIVNTEDYSNFIIHNNKSSKTESGCNERGSQNSEYMTEGAFYEFSYGGIYDDNYNYKIKWYNYNPLYTLNIKTSDSWEQLNVYLFDTSNKSSINTWPGQKLTPTDGTYTLSGFYTMNLGIVINNKKDGEDSSAQTADLFPSTGTNNYYIASIGNKVHYAENDEEYGEYVKTNASGYATFVSYRPLTIPSGIAYYAEDNGNGSATAHALTTPAAGTPMLIKGTPNTYYHFAATATGTDVSSTNAFHAGSGTAVSSTDGDNHNYILNGDSFYKAAGQTVGTKKAYLQLSQAATARVLLFDDEEETTGITSIKSENSNIYFDLQGRRVAQPTKGLYIVNGKKYFAK